MSLEYIETGTFATQGSRLATPGTLRVVSWNINRGSCFDQIVDFLASANADLILLQECDLHAPRSGSRNIACEIAQSLNMNYVFGVEFIELSQGTSALHGQATLARTQLSNPRILRFKQQSNFWKPRWLLPNLPKLQRRLGGRMALVTETTIDGRKLAVYNLHLESRNGDRLRCQQLCGVLNDTPQYGTDAPILIAGDFNLDVTRGASAAVIQNAQFRNPFANNGEDWTTQSGRLRCSRMIDWMLIGGSVGSECSRVHWFTPGSDHYPISLSVRLC